jgi:hypothetical protein
MSIDPIGPPYEERPPKGPINEASSHHTTETNAFSVDDDLQTCRCVRCQRVLTAPLSQFLGAGPVCRRHLLEAELPTAVASFTDLAVAR